MAILNKDIKFKEEITKFLEAEDKDQAVIILSDALEEKMQKIKLFQQFEETAFYLKIISFLLLV